MSLADPTQDRILLGLVAGAVVGGVLLAFSPIGGGGPLVGLFAALVLAFYLPLVFVPLWWGARALRLPNIVGAPVSGGVALLLAPVVINLILWQELPSTSDWTGNLAAFLGVGAAVGLVVWRVSRFNIDAVSNGG